MTDKTKEELLNGRSLIEFDFMAKNSFKFFVEELLDIKTKGGIHDFQLNWIRAIQRHNKVIIKAATGLSKTMTIGVWFTLWECYKKKDLKILIFSRTLDQAKNDVFGRIKEAIEGNPFLVEIFGDEKTAKKWKEGHIITKQNDEIRVRPYKNTVRGSRAHIIYCDEADSYEESNTYFKDVVTRLFPGGKLILTSTPDGPTNLFYEIKKRDEKTQEYYWIITPIITRKDGSLFDPKTFNMEDFKYAKPTWEEMFPLDVIINERWNVQGRFDFISQQLCEVLGETSNSPFPLKNIIGCYNKNLGFSQDLEEGAVYFIGADFASSDGEKADFCAFSVIQFYKDTFILKWLEKLPKGTKYPEVLRRLQELYEIYNKNGTCRIIADGTNIGEIIVPKIRNAGMSVLAQKFPWTVKRDMIRSVGIVMQNGMPFIQIPVAGGINQINEIKVVDELQRQLAGFEEIKSVRGELNYKAPPANVHDDLAISFIMALYHASKMSITIASPILVSDNTKLGQTDKSMVKIVTKEGLQISQDTKEKPRSLVRIVNL